VGGDESDRRSPACSSLAKGLSRKDLQDHAEELLDAIVSDMKSSQSSHQQTEKSKGRDRGGALSGVVGGAERSCQHSFERVVSSLGWFVFSLRDTRG